MCWDVSHETPLKGVLEKARTDVVKKSGKNVSQALHHTANGDPGAHTRSPAR